jgi:hypothetical protein
MKQISLQGCYCYAEMETLCNNIILFDIRNYAHDLPLQFWLVNNFHVRLSKSDKFLYVYFDLNNEAWVEEWVSEWERKECSIFICLLRDLI